MSSPADTALELTALHFSYPDKADVLRGINLRVAAGERVGLIGPNGAGKTTLFLIICGILQPASGRVRLLGQAVSQGRFNPKVAMIFQKPDDQLFCPSVWDDVAFGPQNMGLTDEEVDHRVRGALKTVGVLELVHRPVHHLSGGEKRLVSLAGALAMRPKMIIHDEPSAGLDIRSRRRLISILQNSAQTMLLASHDLELVLEVCTRVVLMDQGRIVADGAPRVIMADETLMAAHGQEKPHSLVPHQIEHQH
jgi:cobalt/nickel transport system ATP-binding protein